MPREKRGTASDLVIATVDQVIPGQSTWSEFTAAGDFESPRWRAPCVEEDNRPGEKQ